MAETFATFMQSLNAPLVVNSPVPTRANAVTAIPFTTLPRAPVVNPTGADSAPSKMPLLLALGAAGLLAWYFLRKSNNTGSASSEGAATKTYRRRSRRRTTGVARSRKTGRFSRRRTSSTGRKGRKTVTWAAGY